MRVLLTLMAALFFSGQACASVFGYKPEPCDDFDLYVINHSTENLSYEYDVPGDSYVQTQKTVDTKPLHFQHFPLWAQRGDDQQKIHIARIHNAGHDNTWIRIKFYNEKHEKVIDAIVSKNNYEKNSQYVLNAAVDQMVPMGFNAFAGIENSMGVKGEPGTSGFYTLKISN